MRADIMGMCCSGEEALWMARYVRDPQHSCQTFAATPNHLRPFDTLLHGALVRLHIVARFSFGGWDVFDRSE
jgi:hypothetical protein